MVPAWFAVFFVSCLVVQLGFLLRFFFSSFFKIHMFVCFEEGGKYILI